MVLNVCGFLPVPEEHKMTALNVAFLRCSALEVPEARLWRLHTVVMLFYTGTQLPADFGDRVVLEPHSHVPKDTYT